MNGPSRYRFILIPLVALALLVSPWNSSADGYRQPRSRASSDSRADTSKSRSSAGNTAVPDSSAWTLAKALKQAKSKNKAMRLAAIARLTAEPGEIVRLVLTKLAERDKSSRVRFEAVRALVTRAEIESLPVLVHIAESDKDWRVRTEATAGYKSFAQPVAPVAPAPAPSTGYGAPVSSTPPPPSPVAPQPFPTPSSVAPAPVPTAEPSPPPWEESSQAPSGAASAGDSKVGKSRRLHLGFMPQLGFDGAIGTPRDATCHSEIGIQVGMGRGKYRQEVRLEHSNVARGTLSSVGDFSTANLEVALVGRWALNDFIELGTQIEIYTHETLVHARTWRMRSMEATDWFEITPSDADWDLMDADASYDSHAFGLVSLEFKSMFVRTDAFRLGIALRATVPSHTGARFDKGLGASDIYLPGITNRVAHYTDRGRVWGVEPGILMSLSPSEHFAVYADLSFSMAFLSFMVISEVLLSDGTTGVAEYAGNSKNIFFIPHVGMQVGFLDSGAFGLQVAVSPAVYVGASGDPHFAGLAIVPGIEAVFAKRVHASVTVDVSVLGSAQNPFECTNTKTDDSQSSVPTPCGLGRGLGGAFRLGFGF